MNGLISYLRSLGFRALRPSIYIWFSNFIFSLFIYWGYFRLFTGIAGKTKVAANINSEMGLFTFFNDVANSGKGSFSLMITLAILAIVLFLGVSIFAAGGIYSVLVRDERTTFSNLIASSVENFYDMLKVFLINIVNWVIAAIIPFLLLLVFITSDSLRYNETAITIFIYFWIGITLLIYTFSMAVYDFSRVLRLKEEKNNFYILKEAFLYTLSNKINILMIFLSYFVSLVLVLLVYVIFSHFLENVLYVFFLFLIYQGFIIARYFLKIAVMRAEVKLMEITG